MRHIPEGNPFQAEERYPGATMLIKRALAQVNLDSQQVQRVLAACKAAKLKAQSPIYDDVNWAHIGIPAKKVCIFLQSCGVRDRMDAKREGWKRVGWTMLSVTFSGVDRLTDDLLVKHLGDAVRGLCK